VSETIALVGSETLMGRELRELLESTSLGADVRLIASSEESAGVLSEHAGEPALVNRLEAAYLVDADVVIIAGAPDAARQVVEMKVPAALIDLTHFAEEDPRTRLRAPLVETHNLRVPQEAIHEIAHPAAIALAIFHQALSREHMISRWVVNVFEPASELGASGVDELQQQTLSLLSFRPMPKKIFDNQLSFSLLARLGEEAAVTLQSIESRIERHLATLLENASGAPMPSLRLIQAPVFHGYSFSIWVEFSGERPGPAALEALLNTDDINVYERDSEPPNNVGTAGQDGIAIGAIDRDPNDANSLWFWMTADNLRLPAQNAVLVARELL
jgi:aspartate-semialdehyde dehydrogenase